MLRKLQRKTLILAQIAGYALTLLVGVAIVLLAVQVYCDLKPLLDSKTDVFSAHTVTVSKNVTVFKTANKEGLYFSEKELKRLKEQEFVKDPSVTISELAAKVSASTGDDIKIVRFVRFNFGE